MQNHSFTLPDFKNSIVNVAASMSQFLGNQPQHKTLPALTAKLDHQFRNVIFLVIDGMGEKILEKNLPAKSFLRRHQIATVTSVFPSTTAAATTSLVSALTPAAHGWLAWTLDFNGAVVELFRSRNLYTKTYLNDRDFVRKTLSYPTFWSSKTLSRRIFTCMPEISYKYPIPNQILYQSSREMWHKLHQTCKTPEPKFIYTYFPELDSLMHHHGTQSNKVRQFLQKLDRKIATFARRHPDTQLVITADHGQIDVKGYAYICHDTELQNCLAHPPAWDFRATSFSVKPGHEKQFLQAFQKYAADFVLYPFQDLIEQGLFGDFSQHPQNRQYCGDYLAIGTDTNKIMVLQHPGNPKKLHRGSHSGMTPEEMLVPVIVATGKE